MSVRFPRFFQLFSGSSFSLAVTPAGHNHQKTKRNHWEDEEGKDKTTDFSVSVFTKSRMMQHVAISIFENKNYFI